MLNKKSDAYVHLPAQLKTGILGSLIFLFKPTEAKEPNFTKALKSLQPAQNAEPTDDSQDPLLL